jgi:peptidoglycan hydrolase-like protein with peptidoglycan-binding domain
MEQLLRLLPLIIAGAQRIPELQQIPILLRQLGTTTFPGLSADQASIAAATTLDANGVKWVQTALNVLLNASLEVDGVYGPATKAAVTRFQSANKLEADGWAGTKTADALRGALTAKYSSS